MCYDDDVNDELCFEDDDCILFCGCFVFVGGFVFVFGFVGVCGRAFFRRRFGGDGDGLVVVVFGELIGVMEVVIVGFIVDFVRNMFVEVCE